MRWWAPGIGGGALAGAVVGGEVPLAAKRARAQVRSS